ncbi:hypothetical protein GH714_007775 [Hevea brasiliensis]|uniref:UV-stimulated scaffold protein A C-terminal domain-containing protein n=1 Tax=Hevea brasiliensis TaxID=3981 RepID=A0A6A6LWB2_HEVBR|nr:hypothetical protein GH714_007775 [Hevea brasiliensis]
METVGGFRAREGQGVDREGHKFDGGAGEPRLLKAIKSVVRYSDSELRLAAQTLMDLMKCDHSQVRYLTLLIIDQLFMRSKLFRTLLVENLDQLLSLSVGFRRNLPLPAPPAVASVLRSKAIEFLEKWNDSFGIHYRQIRLGFDYLKNTLRFQFPNIQANAAQERREREMRSKEILQSKFEILKGNLSSIKEEIQSTLDEIGECLEIVRTEQETMPPGPLDDEDFVEFRPSELRQIRLDSLREEKRFMRTVRTKWVEVPDNRSRDSVLKEFIDIQNRLQSVKKKCVESGYALPDTTKREKDEEEDFGRRTKNDSPESSKGKAKCDQSQSCKGTDSSSLRSKLLAEAPVVKWGNFLNNWDSNRVVLANQRGLELESHWGRVDYNARRDLRVCPFHGPVIPRDDEGNPINKSTSTSDTTLDSDLIEQLAKQAVKNVRNRENEEANKRKLDKQSQKRAKLAKIREHNEAVLRDAALASTSNSVFAGEDVKATTGGRLARNKKKSLASMLHKKESTKDRLAQRLLNTRARDATIRLVTLGEDANYREAFPNQW